MSVTLNLSLWLKMPSPSALSDCLGLAAAVTSGQALLCGGAALCVAGCSAASWSLHYVPVGTSSHLVAAWELLLWGEQKTAPCLGSHGDLRPSQPPHIQCPRPGPLSSSCDSQTRRPHVTRTASLLSQLHGDSAARVRRAARGSVTDFLSFS